MKEVFLTQDRHDDERVSMYSINDKGRPFTMMSTFHVDDIHHLFGPEILNKLNAKLVKVKIKEVEIL